MIPMRTLLLVLLLGCGGASAQRPASVRRVASIDRVRVKPRPSRTLFEIARENAVEGCVRETFGALVNVYRRGTMQTLRFVSGLAFAAAAITLSPVAKAQTAPTTLVLPVTIASGKTTSATRLNSPCPAGQSFYVTRFDAWPLVEDPTRGTREVPTGRWLAFINVTSTTRSETGIVGTTFHYPTISADGAASGSMSFPGPSPFGLSYGVRLPGALASGQLRFLLFVTGSCAASPTPLTIAVSSST
jgi:hypothetical protein